MRKNITVFHAVENGDMSNDITSPVTNVQYLDNVGIQLVYDGDPVGTFTIEGSVGESKAFTTLTNLATISASGSGDSILLNLQQVPYTSIRIVYTAGSGAGTLNAHLTSKMI